MPDNLKKTDAEKSLGSAAKPNIVMLLRLCTVLLATVSFWSTAQGMKQYTFEQGWQAYAASLAIQGLLLGLNFSLPHFLKQYDKKLKRIPLIVFSLVVLACSSWFSFLYIARHGYQDSWDTKCQLMAQEIYRDQLYAADSYAERYDEALNQQLSDQILELYNEAAVMGSDEAVISPPDWDTERADYVTNGGAAAGEMNTVINTMETAMAEDAPQNVRQQAQEILTTQQQVLQSNIDSLAAQIVEAQQAVDRNLDILQRAESSYNRRPEDADPAPYQSAVATASSAWQRSIDRMNELQQRHQSYQDALLRVNYYASLLGMAEEGVDTYFIGTNLREIQKELFQPAPDLDRLMTLATEIFDRLQSAEELNAENGTDYQEFMSMMNSFINNLEKRRQMKDSKATLQQLVQDLADGKLLPIQGSSADVVTSQPPEISEAPENSGTPEDGDPPDNSGAPEDSDSPENSAAPESSTAPEAADNPVDSSSADWIATWITQFNELKFRISGLPIYSGDISFLSQSDPLRFDRGESTKVLDRAVERYLTDHNDAEQGLIYLASDYRAMAVFALILALLLDLAAFVTGIIIEREERKPPAESKDTANRYENRKVVPWGYGQDDGPQPQTRCLNRYLFLTGDYVYMDGIYTYNVIEQGTEGQITLTEPGKKSGLYLWHNQILSSILEPQAEDSEDGGRRDLLYKVDTNGPADGVYPDSLIAYEAGLLYICQGEESTFLGNVDPYVPVYCLSPETYDAIPIKDLKDHSILIKSSDDRKNQIVVVALDWEGKKISVIYIIWP